MAGVDTVTTAAQVLDIARQELGTREAPNGSNPYGRAYGVDRVAWCAQFTWWCFRQAGAADLTHPKTAYTPTLYDWYRSRGQASNSPRVGDLVFYDWPDSVHRIQHVGLVEAIEPSAIVTIEGNTATSNQSDGGGVMRRRRARNSSIVGYGHPAYTAPSPQEDDMTPEQAAQLSLLVTQLVTGPDPEAWGWNTFPGGSMRADGSHDRFTAVDYLRHGNQRDEDLDRGIAALRDEVRQLAARPTAAVQVDYAQLAKAGPPALSDADVARIAAAVLAELSSRTAD